MEKCLHRRQLNHLHPPTHALLSLQAIAVGNIPPIYDHEQLHCAQLGVVGLTVTLTAKTIQNIFLNTIRTFHRPSQLDS